MSKETNYNKIVLWIFILSFCSTSAFAQDGFLKGIKDFFGSSNNSTSSTSERVENRNQGSAADQLEVFASRVRTGQVRDVFPYVQLQSNDEISNEREKTVELYNSLPLIDNYQVTVHPGVKAIRDKKTIVEIFSSTEKSTYKEPKPGQNIVQTDNWLSEMAEIFNREAAQSGMVSIRNIDSGTAYQYILKANISDNSITEYQIDAFSPSNDLWVRMAESQGVKVQVVNESLLHNVAGIVIRKDVLARLGKTQRDFTISDLADAVIKGELRMGYTNPFMSSTGVNFLAYLIQQLDVQGTGINSGSVVESFRKFQQGVPITYETTLQLREAVLQGETLDAMVMEYQTFILTEGLSDKTVFVPFGETHNNPLVAIGNISKEQMAVLTEFSEWLKKDPRALARAKEYGFNRLNDYHGTDTPVIDGGDLVSIQKLWKKEKSGGAKTVAIFLGDVSGSMEGSRINNVRKALVEGAEFISEDSQVGLVVFNSSVIQTLPISEFSSSHKDNFISYAQAMQVRGGTSMYDGIAYSSNIMVKHIKDLIDNYSVEGVRPVLIVLTDGESMNDGLVSQDSRRIRDQQISELMGVIKRVNIPTYILGVELGSGVSTELKSAATQTGGDSFSVNSDNVVSRIVQLLYTQL